MERIGGRDTFLDGRESVGELIALLGHASLRVRRSAVAALADRDPAETLPGVLAALGDSDNAAARSAASDVLLRYGAAVLRPLARALDPDRQRDRTIQILTILGKMPGPETLDAVLPLATHHDASIAAAAISCLGALKDPTCVPVLLSVLEQGERWQTFYAIDALGEVRHAAAVKRLVPMIADAYYRKAVLRALGKIGDESAITPVVEAMLAASPCPDKTALVALSEMVERAGTGAGRAALVRRIRSELGRRDSASLAAGLARLSRERDADLRRRALRALGWLEAAEVVVPLVEALAEPFLAATAVEALTGLGPERAEAILAAAAKTALPTDGLRRLVEILAPSPAVPVEGFLLAALRHEESEVRQAAAAAVATRVRPEHLEALVHALGDPSALVSGEAIRGLLHLAQESESRRDEVAGRVEGLTASSSPSMRSAALRVVARLGSEGARETLDLALQDPAPEVRRVAVALVGEESDPERLWRLTAALADEDSRVREEAVVAVGRLKDRRARGVLLSSLHDRSIWVRCRAARALAEHPAVEVQAALEEAARRELPPVRVAAVEALGELGTDVHDILCSLAADPEPEVRRASLKALGAGRGRAPLERLAAGLEDTAWSVRCAAAEALGQLREAGAFPPLALALDRERDPVVRAALLTSMYHVDPEASLSALVNALAEKDVAETAAALLVEGHGIFADELRAEWASGIDPAVRAGLAVVLEEIGRREAAPVADDEGLGGNG